jgi:hypothetical protein
MSMPSAVAKIRSGLTGKSSSSGGLGATILRHRGRVGFLVALILVAPRAIVEVVHPSAHSHQQQAAATPAELAVLKLSFQQNLDAAQEKGLTKREFVSLIKRADIEAGYTANQVEESLAATGYVPPTDAEDAAEAQSIEQRVHARLAEMLPNPIDREHVYERYVQLHAEIFEDYVAQLVPQIKAARLKAIDASSP